MRTFRIEVPWRSLYTNKDVNAGGSVIPTGDWAATEDLKSVRTSGEARAFQGVGAPTLIPGLEFANVESTPLAVAHALPVVSSVQRVWTPNAWFPPDVDTPWVDISVYTGKYLLVRPVWTVYTSSGSTLHMVDARALYEFRGC